MCIRIKLGTLMIAWTTERRQGLEASPGEIVTACPRCGKHEAGTVQYGMSADGAFKLKNGTFHCFDCHHDFAEPAYYQKVPKP